MNKMKLSFRTVGGFAVVAIMVLVSSCASYPDGYEESHSSGNGDAYVTLHQDEIAKNNSLICYAAGDLYLNDEYFKKALYYFNKGARLNNAQSVEPAAVDCAYGLCATYFRMAWTKKPRGDEKMLIKSASYIGYLFSNNFQKKRINFFKVALLGNENRGFLKKK